MNLIELSPRWIESSWDWLQGIRFGVTFECPHCRTQRLAILFDPPFGAMEKLPLAPWADPRKDAEYVWRRSGETFDSLTLTPSVDAAFTGHWHGTITAGEVR